MKTDSYNKPDNPECENHESDPESSVSYSYEIARKVLPMLSKHGIPINPTNYRLWYEYFSGRSPQLQETFDGLIRDGVTFTPELSENLFIRFFSNEATEDRARLVEQAGDRVQSMAVEIVKELLCSIVQAKEYSLSLGSFLEDVNLASDLGALKGIIQGVFDQTGRIRSSQQALRSSMEATSEELDLLKQELKRKEELSLTDELTGLPNRRLFNIRMAEEVSKSKRYQILVSLIIFDLDDFKRVNDTFGHVVGDRLLAKMARVIRRSVRDTDVAARYGGEEFAIICTHTGLDEAVLLADRIRSKIMEKDFTVKGMPLKVTVSGGVAAYEPEEEVEDFIDRADKGLYLGKKSGKNRVCTIDGQSRAE